MKNLFKLVIGDFLFFKTKFFLIRLIILIKVFFKFLKTIDVFLWQTFILIILIFIIFDFIDIPSFFTFLEPTDPIVEQPISEIDCNSVKGSEAIFNEAAQDLEGMSLPEITESVAAELAENQTQDTTPPPVSQKMERGSNTLPSSTDGNCNCCNNNQLQSANNRNQCLCKAIIESCFKPGN